MELLLKRYHVQREFECTHVTEDGGSVQSQNIFVLWSRIQ